MPETPIILTTLHSFVSRVQWTKATHTVIQNAPHKAASGHTNNNNDDHAPAAPPPLRAKPTINEENERRFERALLQLEEMAKKMNDPTQVDLPERVMALEDEVALLREQVKFLEDLVMSQIPRLSDHNLPKYTSTASNPSTPLIVPYSNSPKRLRRGSLISMITDLELDTAYSIDAQSTQAYSYDPDHFENLHLSGTDAEVTTLTVPLCELEALPYTRRRATSECSSTSVATNYGTELSLLIGGSTYNACSCLSNPASPSAYSDFVETRGVYLFDRDFMLDQEPTMPTLTTSSTIELPSRGSRSSTLEVLDISLTEKRLECQGERTGSGSSRGPTTSSFLCNPAQA